MILTLCLLEDRREKGGRRETEIKVTRACCIVSVFTPSRVPASTRLCRLASKETLLLDIRLSRFFDFSGTICPYPSVDPRVQPVAWFHQRSGNRHSCDRLRRHRGNEHRLWQTRREKLKISLRIVEWNSRFTRTFNYRVIHFFSSRFFNRVFEQFF